MSLTSANINDLATFINGSSTRVNTLADSLRTTATKFESVFMASGGSGGSQSPDTPSLGALNSLLTSWMQNDSFVNEVRNNLIAADNYDADGNATVSDAAVRQSLEDAGLDRAPDLVEVAAIVLYGEPPYSGFRDDPIGMANGNFLLREGDIQVFGVAAGLSVIRTYNSRDSSPGAFGTGWTSIVDVALQIHEDQVTFRGADGGGAVFARSADDGWTGDRRRGLSLVEVADGWEVAEGHHQSWHFDEAGVLIAVRTLAADVTVEREPGVVAFTDQTSGRWVRYLLDESLGRVTRTEVSDGRAVTYAFTSQGQLAEVARGTGTVTYDYDDRGFLSTVTDADGVLVCQNVYDNVGRVLSQVERHGRTSMYDYRPDGVAVDTATDGSPPNVMVHDRRGRMTAMIDGLGNAMRIAYDDDDNITQIVDRSGAITTYEHDDRGNLVLRTDPDGLTQRATWDDADRLLTATDRSGATMRFDYEGGGRDPSRIILADGSETRLTYDDSTGLPTSAVDADGVSVVMTWTRDGLLDTLTDGLGATIALEYDAAGRSVGATGPEDARASVTLDVAGRMLALHTAYGEQTFEYTAAGRLIGGRGEAGARWGASLDSAADIAGVADDIGPLLGLEHDLIGRITAATTPDGARTTYGYDPVGRRTTTTDPLDHRHEVAFDAEGRVIQQTDPSGRSIAFSHDELGRPTQVTTSAGETSLRTYHPNGQLATVTNAAGSTWRYDLDDVGRVTTATDPLGHVTTFSYTPAGRLEEVRSAAGRTTRGEYDDAGRLARLVEPDGTEVVFDRRLDGALTRVTRDGIPTSYTYDEAGRISAVSAPDGSSSLERAFGEVVGFHRAGAAPARFEHDARGQLSRAIDPAGVVTDFSYDAAGRLVAHTTGESSMSFSWDAAGDMQSVTDPYGSTTDFERDERGAITRIARPDGSVTVRRFGADGRLDGAVDADGSTLLTIERDSSGQVSEAAMPGSHLNVAQDAVGQITGVGTDVGVVRYGYEPDGYLSSLSDGGDLQVTFEHGTADRPTSFRLGDGRHIQAPGSVDLERDGAQRVVTDEGGRRYTYDLAGRLASATVGGAATTYEYNDLGLLATEHTPIGTRTYRYGLAGELLEQSFEDGSQTTFRYDPTGRRVAETSTDGTSAFYAWDAFGRLASIARVAADGTETRQQIDHDPLGRPMRVDGVGVLWDGAATGSLLGVGEARYLWWGNQVREVTDPDSAWSRRLTDDPWGVDGGQGVRMGYRGELALDDLVFLGARVYDARSRTFLSRDPLPSRPGAVTFAGVYSYAWCDPVNMVDPSGKQPISDQQYDELRKDANRGLFGRIADDPWNYVAKAAIVVGSVAVMAVATATLGPVGIILAGALVGAVGEGLKTAVDGGDWGDVGRSALIGGVVGGLSGGLAVKFPTPIGASLVNQVSREGMKSYPLAMVQEGADSWLPGSNSPGFDFDNVLIEGTIGTVGGVGGNHLEAKIRDFNPDVAPAPAPVPAPTPAAPAAPTILDPNRSSAFDLSTASAADLDKIPGLGSVLSERIVVARSQPGWTGSMEDLLEIQGIGPAKAQAILDAAGA